MPLLLAEVNAFFETPMLVDVGEHAGGNKCLQAYIAVGAVNYMDVPGFIEHCRSVVRWEWYCTDFAQLVIQDEHADGFGLVEVYRANERTKPWSWENEQGVRQ